VTCRKPSPTCGGSHHRLSHDIGTSPNSRPHATQCGYRHRRILIKSGYKCNIVSQRVTSTWSSMNDGTTSGRFQSSPRTCQKEQQKKRQGREKHSLRKSKCPRNEGWARQKQHRQTKAQRRRGPRRGKRRIHSRPKNNRNRLRQCRGPPQVPTHRNQVGIRGQLHR
jgi:hypothetical protein